MNYTEYTFSLQGSEGYHQDLLIQALAEIGFDTFEEKDNGFSAYIPTGEDIDQQITLLADQYAGMFTFSYQTKLIPHQNWNEVWESNFEPLAIRNRCYVRATFHEAHPEFEYEIVVDPKMAFGTGHHQTTALVMGRMMEMDFKGKKVLDMGCGTGILAILASKMGAKELLAIDYDPICFESTIENCTLNQVDNVIPLCGSKEVIPEEKFDIILANINRNILLDQIDRYAAVLSSGGQVILSGFYQVPDLEFIKEKCALARLNYVTLRTDSNWVAAHFAKAE